MTPSLIDTVDSIIAQAAELKRLLEAADCYFVPDDDGSLQTLPQMDEDLSDAIEFVKQANEQERES